MPEVAWKVGEVGRRMREVAVLVEAASRVGGAAAAPPLLRAAAPLVAAACSSGACAESNDVATGVGLVRVSRCAPARHAA